MLICESQSVGVFEGLYPGTRCVEAHTTATLVDVCASSALPVAYATAIWDKAAISMRA